MRHLELEGRFDQPRILDGSKEHQLSLLLSIMPSADLQAIEAGAAIGTHICLLIDVSQSMEEDDKLDAAVNAARELIMLVDAHDSISIVAFDEEVYTLSSHCSGVDKDNLIEALNGLRSVGGGMTNMAMGLKGANEQLCLGQNDGQARVILLLSDGEDNFCKADALNAAVLATDANVQIFAIGIGADYDANFLKAVIAPSNGSLFGDTDVEKIKEAFIDVAVTLANVVATQASLNLRFHRDALVGKSYKASPDQLFLGSPELDKERCTLRRVGNIERNKKYAFLFEVTAPAAGRGVWPVLTVSISYDVPALGVFGATAEQTYSVEYLDNVSLTTARDGAVLECYRRVQITELVERFVDAHQGGNAEKTARYLELLIQKYDDVNDQKMVNHYSGIRTDLIGGGLITKAMLNASVIASTIVQGGGELPRLVDDTF